MPGLGEATAVRLGADEVAALYLGATQVWSAAPTPTANDLLWSANFDASQSGGLSASGGTTTMPELYSPSTGATGDYGGGEYNSGGGTAVASTDHALTGSWSAKLTAQAPFSSGTRLFRWRELRTNRHAICEAWFYFPEPFALTHDPLTGRYLDLFQFKSQRPAPDAHLSDPFWYVTPEPDGEGGHTLAAVWGYQSEIEGPREGQTGYRFFRPSTPIALPIGEWFGLRAYIMQSKDFDGAIRFWFLPPDGTPRVIAALSGVRTGWPVTTFNAWHVAQRVSVNNYTDGITLVDDEGEPVPGPYSLYVDRFEISTVIFGAERAPDAPRSAVASAINGGVRVSAIVAPDYDGGAAVDGYRVTVTGGATATGASSPIDVTGLANGTPVDVTIEAHNAHGYGSPLALGTVTPAVPPYETIAQTGSSARAYATATTSFVLHRPEVVAAGETVSGSAANGNVAEVAIVIGTGSGGPAVNTTITSVPGWTLITGPIAAGGTGELGLSRYRRILDGTANDTFTATTGLACRGALVMATLSHPDAGTQEDATPASNNASSGTTLNVGPITTTTDTAWALGAWACLTGSGTMTAPSGMTLLASAVASGSYRISMFASGAISPSGVFAARSPTYNASRVSAGIIDALRPAHL